MSTLNVLLLFCFMSCAFDQDENSDYGVKSNIEKKDEVLQSFFREQEIVYTKKFFFTKSTDNFIIQETKYLTVSNPEFQVARLNFVVQSKGHQSNQEQVSCYFTVFVILFQNIMDSKKITNMLMMISKHGKRKLQDLDLVKILLQPLYTKVLHYQNIENEEYPLDVLSDMKLQNTEKNKKFLDLLQLDFESMENPKALSEIFFSEKVSYVGAMEISEEGIKNSAMCDNCFERINLTL